MVLGVLLDVRHCQIGLPHVADMARLIEDPARALAAAMKAPVSPMRSFSPWLASLWEIDVIDDAIADEQLLSPSLREQLAKERISEDNTSSSVDTAIEPMERVKAG